MALNLEPLKVEDAERCVTIYFAAFQNAHSLACWPRDVPAVRQWWENMIRDELTEPGSRWFKVVSSDTNEIVGYCKWRKYEGGHEPDTNLPKWPDGADARLADETFGEWARKHPEFMGRRAHWCMSL